MRTHLSTLALGLLLGLGLSSPAWGQAATKARPSTAAKTKATATKVDLNTATADELQELPGIGPARAEAIIAARPFKSVADLKKLDEIPGRVYDEVAPRLTASAAPVAATKPAAKVMTKPATSRARAAAKEAAKEDDAAHQNRKKAALAPGRKINLNTATVDELQELPGIGAVRSAAIVKARPFETIEDVMKVDGIKEGIFAQIKDHISVK